MAGKFQTIQTGDWNTQKIQDNVSAVLNPLLALPFSDAVFIQDVSLSSGSNNVNHGLGRPPQFWSVVRQNAQADIWETTTQSSAIYLVLNSSANCVVSLWVA